VAKQFKGKISLDIRDSTADWDAFLPDTAPIDAPNVLVVLYDDTGCAAWSPYGGRIEMPTLQRLADGGLTYSQWHTTALCSPTRSVFLTGRNHHQNGFATISESSTIRPTWWSVYSLKAAYTSAIRENSRFSSSESVSHGRTASPGAAWSGLIGLIGVSSVPSGRMPRSTIRGSTHSR
jgi:hypothetical protein